MEDIDRSAPHFEGTLPCKLVRIIAPSHASSTTSLSSLSMTSGSGSVSTSPVTETKQVDMTLRLYGGAQMKVCMGETYHVGGRNTFFDFTDYLVATIHTYNL